MFNLIVNRILGSSGEGSFFYLGLGGIALMLGTAAMLPTPAKAQGANALEEIVVTARRREELLQDVPVAISVLNDTFLEDAGFLTILRCTRRSPVSNMVRCVTVSGVSPESEALPPHPRISCNRR